MIYSVVSVFLLVLATVKFSSCITDELPSVVNIGAVLAYDSLIGGVAKVAIEEAIKDVNSDTQILQQTQLNLLIHDSGCSPFRGAIGVLQAIDHQSVAIIGPQSSEEAHTISSLSTDLQIPFVSFAATDPTLSSFQFPFLTRTAQTDAYQMSGMAELIEHFGWRKVTAVFTDDEYGRNGINFLEDELDKKLTKVYKIALPFRPSREQIAHLLRSSKMLGPRVYVVHVAPDSGLDVFSVAQQLNMMTEGYAWFTTDWLSTSLDTSGDYTSLNSLEGVVGFKQYIPQSSSKDAFISRWKRLQNEGVVKYNLNSYGFYAYDAVWALAHAIDEFLNESRNLTFSINKELLSAKGMINLKMLKTFDGGQLLFEKISRLNFTGLSSQLQFDSDGNRRSSAYEIINIDGKLRRKVGYWSSESGLSTVLPESSYASTDSSLKNQSLGSVTWPGGRTETPRGWVVASSEKPLRVGVPYRVSFVEFVTVIEQGTKADVSGYCIDVFRAAIRLIQYDVPVEFVPVGDGLCNPSYDRLVKMISDQVIDGAVGDIAIVTNRSRTVDFTMPYISTGLVIVAPMKMIGSSEWVFYRPFTDGMWCTTAAFFFLIAFVIWLLEYRVNNAFRGPPQRQIIRTILFSFSTLFKTQSEPVLSPLGRFVMVVWLFLLMVITSSYTASLTSFLTVRQLLSPMKDIDALVASNLPIGYQVGSFAKSYLEDNYNVQRSRLVALGTPEAYKEALERGPENGGVAAIVDELPYVQLFLEQTKGFGIIGQQFTRSGWGFAFPKDSQLEFDMSRAILKLSENGELQKIHDKWLCKANCDTSESSKPNQLHLRSFWRLFTICGITIVVSILVFFTRAIRQFANYESSRQRDLPSTLQQGDSIRSCSIVKFFNFIDEKEVANEVVKQHTDSPSPHLDSSQAQTHIQH